MRALRDGRATRKPSKNDHVKTAPISNTSAYTRISTAAHKITGCTAAISATNSGGVRGAMRCAAPTMTATASAAKSTEGIRANVIDVWSQSRHAASMRK
jgi:hypothetical protein